MIPEAKQSLVARALKEAFGVDEPEDIRRLTAGLSSALVYRIVVRSCPYVLRVITRTDAMNDPTRQFACMKSGAEKGIAPRVLYTSIEDRISITDFVESRPLSVAEALMHLPVTLRTLHSLPPFPKAGSEFDAFLDRMLKNLPESLAGELNEIHSRLSLVYPQDDPSNLVSCHHDLKPENILFDGDRVWLIDWEASFSDDRYFDLAVAANFWVHSEADEQTWLHRYFEEPAGEYRMAQFLLMRQRMHVLYAIVFLSLATTSGKTIDTNLDVPDFREFHHRIVAGQVNLADAGAKLEYGLVHLRQLRDNERTARFKEMLSLFSSSRPAGGQCSIRGL